MQKCISLSKIKSNPIVRDTTGIPELDFIYGYSFFPDCTLWGLPEGKISLWAAESGTGKSRIAIEVCRNMSQIYFNSKILYFQTEAEIEDFASWVPDPSRYKNIFCSGEDRIKKIINIIYQERPKIVFIDSVNEIADFENGNKKEARRLIHGITDEKGNIIEIGIRKVCHDVGCHLIFLGQLNQNGTIKGGTSLPHLVDIALDLTKCYIEDKKGFDIKIGIKHRHGRSDKDICGKWLHTDAGVKCISKNRDFDEIWCKNHGYSPLKPVITPEIPVKEEVEAFSPFVNNVVEYLQMSGMSKEEFADMALDEKKRKKWIKENSEPVAQGVGIKDVLCLPLLGIKNILTGRL